MTEHQSAAVPRRDPLYDVFICYTWADGKQWADDMHAALEALDSPDVPKLRVFQDDRSVPETDEYEMLPTVKAALLNSRVVVPLITPCFDDSDHCWSELHLALTCAKALGGTAMRRIVPLTWKVPPKNVRPKALKSRKLVREGRSVEELADHVARVVDEVRHADARRFGDALTDMPSRLIDDLIGESGFVGRRKELWSLHDALREPGGTRDSGAPLVSVRGPGGSGKSTLCKQYGRWAAKDHPGGVFVVRLSGSDSLGRDDSGAVRAGFHTEMRRIAAGLSLPGHTGTSEDLRRAVGRRLKSLPPYLWIIDDLPSSLRLDDHPYLLAPSPNGKNLVTTRGSVHGRSRVEITLSGLGPRPGLSLLTARRKLVPENLVRENIDERNAARAIVAQLQGHPLALQITAGLTTAQGFTGYRSLLADLRADAGPVLELAEHLGHDLPAHTARPLSGVLLRAFDALPTPASRLLAAASVLAAAPVPHELLVSLLLDTDLPATDRDPHAAAAVTEGVRILEGRGLVETSQDVAGITYSVHALVGRAARVLLRDATRRQTSQQAVRALADLLDGTEAHAASGLRTLGLLTHVQAAANLAAPEGWGVDISRWSLVARSGQLRSDLGDSAGAVDDFRTLYASCRASPLCDPYTTLCALVGFGAVLQENGALTQARELQERAVEELDVLHGRDLFGNPHPDTLWAMNNLANTHQALGNHQEARTLLRKTCHGWHGRHGPSARQTLTALNNLVIAVGRGPGRYAAPAALRIATFAHERWTNTAGSDARGTVDSLFSIGANQLRTGDTAAALTAFEEVRQRRRSHLGDDHPDTLDARENIITARRRAASTAVPDDGSHHALYADRLRVQGPDHPATVTTLWALTRAGLTDLPVPKGEDGTVGEPSDLPDGVDPDDVHLEGDHDELLSDLLVDAVDLQERQVARHGPDAPETVRATLSLAHAMAAANQYEGQRDYALVLAQDAREGIDDLAVRSPEIVGARDQEVARTLHHWILDLLGEDPTH
ncbi:tetratricopeptide repeat protein [Streptomyces sp. NPDC102365]|uniref:tetratricopeptide repeat protein n=1 Tax=Streptomyces sp. NPDC102365 TaxID=3366162 RepID=UPI003827C635